MWCFCVCIMLFGRQNTGSESYTGRSRVSPEKINAHVRMDMSANNDIFTETEMNYPRLKTGGFLRLLFGNFRLAFLVAQVFRDFAGSLLASAGLTILYRRNDLHRLRQCQPRSEVSYYFTCPILDVEGRI